VKVKVKVKDEHLPHHTFAQVRWKTYAEGCLRGKALLT
jgi:hypothetical protein